MEEQKQKDEIHIICINEKEFDYLSTLLNTLYKDLKKFPKKLRTEKFDILEKLIKDYFFTK